MYTCPKCQTILKSKNDYVNHSDGHAVGSKRKVYPCPSCQFSLHNRTSFYTHLKSHEENEPKTPESKAEGGIICRHCKELFTIKTIESHLRSLPGGSKILCPFCESGSHPTYIAYKTHKHR